MATTRTKGSLQITIVASCADDSDKGIKLELDEELNNEDTCFEPNQDIYLRLYLTPEDLDVTLKTTYGSLYATGGGGYSEHEEDITITDGTGSTGYPIHEVDSIDWLGNAPCGIDNVSWTQGSDVLICATDTCQGSPDGVDECEVTYGVVQIVYTSKYTNYVLNVPGAGTVIVYAYENLETD